MKPPCSVLVPSFDFVFDVSVNFIPIPFVLETMAQGVIDLKDAKGFDHVMEHNIQYFLDRFYINRISIRCVECWINMLLDACLP